MALFSGRSPASPAEDATRPRYGVLLVDDEALNLEALAALLESDYEVHTAPEGRTALQVLANRGERIQVVVSDQRMPGMSGVELLTRVRALRPDIKSVLLTGFNDIDAVVRAINEAGIHRYLQKPVEVHELRLALARACETWQLEQDNRNLMTALSQSYERLAGLDAAKTSFLRYLSHEINTPLNWLGATRVIESQSLGEESRRMLEYVDRGRERLYGLVGAVLRYFELGSGELRPVTERIELRETVERVLADARAVLAARGDRAAEVPVQITGATRWSIGIDEQLLGELLGHLLENALAHAARAGGEPRVTVDIEATGDGAEIAVHNSGQTPEDRLIAQLFEPFFFCGSLHGAEGYGLSLATAKALATLLGASLIAGKDTATGDGLVLRLRIPARPADGLAKDGSSVANALPETGGS